MNVFLRCVTTFLLAFPLVAQCEDYFYVVNAPDSIRFNTIESLHSSNVADVFSAMLGYTLPKDVKWKSLAPVNPFKTPRSICVLEISGLVGTTDLNINGFKFPLENSGDLDDQYNILSFRTYHRFGDDHKPILLKLDTGDDLYGQKLEQSDVLKSVPATATERLKLALSDPELGQVVKDGTFNQSIYADAQFLLELETVKLFLEALVEKKALLRRSYPDVYWLKLKTLQSVVDEHGAESYQVKEAYRLLEQIIGESVDVLEKVYIKQAVVSVLAYSNIRPSLTRKSRSLLAETSTAAPANDDKNHNLAYEFHDDFHVAFALVAFTSIVLILAVLGISVGIWFMDPGRDSIIYRMTSQRMKKD